MAAELPCGHAALRGDLPKGYAPPRLQVIEEQQGAHLVRAHSEFMPLLRGEVEEHLCSALFREPLQAAPRVDGQVVRPKGIRAGCNGAGQGAGGEL